MKTIASWLGRLGAHQDVVSWAEPYADDWERAFAECPRSDWLLGIAARVDVERAALVRAAAGCAHLVEPYLGPNKKSAEVALREAEAWAAQGGGESDLRATSEALEALAKASEDAAEAAGLLACAAACRVTYEPESAPAAASQAVEAAVLDAGDCAMMSAMGFMYQKTADAVRKHIARQQIPSPFERR